LFLSVAATPTRKNWLSLTDFERREFTSGINALKLTGKYDELVLLHQIAYNTPCPWGEEVPDSTLRNGDQKGPAFLPWHREYLMRMEHEMQLVTGNSNFALPFWNWMEDSTQDPLNNYLWSADRGIGGTGRQGDSVVVDGPFAFFPIIHSEHNETFLQRTLGGLYSHPAVPGDFNEAFAQTFYDSEPWSAESVLGFRNWVEGFYSSRGARQLSMHAQAHGFIGGSMLHSTSPNDPAFFLVHAFTDGMWAMWQDKQLLNNKNHRNAEYSDHFVPHEGGPRGHNIDDPLIALEPITPRMVLDVNKLPYTYAGFPNLN